MELAHEEPESENAGRRFEFKNYRELAHSYLNKGCPGCGKKNSYIAHNTEHGYTCRVCQCEILFKKGNR